MGVNEWENHEMCNILKMAEIERETNENFGLSVLGTPYVGYFSGQVIENVRHI